MRDGPRFRLAESPRHPRRLLCARSLRYEVGAFHALLGCQAKSAASTASLAQRWTDDGAGTLGGDAMPVDPRVQDLLDEVGLQVPPEQDATIIGHDPILGNRFPVSEAAA